MCGITGWIDWRQDLTRRRDVTMRMTDSLSRRGPDERGEWVSRHAFLGHRRLSIIDLATGQQPMSSGEPDPLILSYSGEVYNFGDLRASLLSLGHSFQTSSDTEVVLRAFLEWGPSSFSQLRGIFAFALWDSKAEKLWLVRDRLGVKPLYYYPTPTGLVFGSEPKTILANPEIQVALGASGICEIFALATAPTPGHGIYEGMHQVKPGEAVSFARQGMQHHRYWSLQASEHRDNDHESSLRVRALLEEIVGQQIVADVPLGSLLSGGLDSTVVASFAAQSMGKYGRRLPTYSVDFPPNGGALHATGWHIDRDEPFAREAARHIGSDHRTIVVPSSEILECENDALLARDGPTWGDLDTSLYILCKNVRERATVALSGEAADEVFGGYPFFHDPEALSHEGFPWLHNKHPFWSLLRDDVLRTIEPDAYVRQRYQEAKSEVPQLDGENSDERRVREVTHVALTRWLPAMLDRKDRMSMATGLEVRVPFCDHELVEYVWNVPWAIRAKNGTGKALLRSAAADIVPKSILERKKSGFPANSDSHYVTRLWEQVRRLLDQQTPIFDLVCRDKVRALVDAGKSFPSPRASNNQAIGLSYLLSMNRWFETYGVSVRI